MSKPEFISFDCYGTLIDFQISDLTRELMGESVGKDHLRSFLRDFSNYRFDEVLGPFKPYPDVIKNALRRSCRRWTIPYPEEVGQQLVKAIPGWKPFPDVVETLEKLAERFPLVILSNAVRDQIKQNINKLGVNFHEVFVSEQIEAYKPRFRPFEFMLEKLGCARGDIVHVSSSLRYDITPANALGLDHLIHVNRNYDNYTPEFPYKSVSKFSQIPPLFEMWTAFNKSPQL